MLYDPTVRSETDGIGSINVDGRYPHPVEDVSLLLSLAIVNVLVGI